MGIHLFVPLLGIAGRRWAPLIMMAQVALVACGLPTVLPGEVTAAATLARAGASPSANGDRPVVPATWTPPPGALEAFDPKAYRLGPLSPSRTPTITPVFPTRTPLPATATPTPLPTNTATPTVRTIRYVNPLPTLRPSGELGPSKLGLHVIRNNDANIMEFVRQAQPAVIKAVGDLGFLAEVKAVSPRTITVGRIHVASQSYAGNPEEAARRFVAEHLIEYQLNPGVDYWEGWNEPDPNMANMSWYARFEQERVRQMAAHGFQTAIGGFSTGVPEYEEFFLFLPAIEVAMQYGGVLTLHEYGAPVMTAMYGSALPGQPFYADRGALAFRYRWFYEGILIPADMVIPLIVTEAGVDGVIGNRGGPAGLGWLDFQSYWVEQGLGESGSQAFINQLAWYDSGVRQDGYVVGFTIFTAGAIGQWASYNVNSILPELTGYVIGQR